MFPVITAPRAKPPVNPKSSPLREGHAGKRGTGERGVQRENAKEKSLSRALARGGRKATDRSRHYRPTIGGGGFFSETGG